MLRGGRAVHTSRRRGGHPSRRPRRPPVRRFGGRDYPPFDSRVGEYNPPPIDRERRGGIPGIHRDNQSSRGFFQGGHVVSPLQAQPQVPSHPQLSSNPATAAIEASLLLLTELAKSTVGSDASENRLGTFGSSTCQPLPSHMNQRFDSISLDGRLQNDACFDHSKDYGNHRAEDWRLSGDNFGYGERHFSSDTAFHQDDVLRADSLSCDERQYANEGIGHRLSSRFHDVVGETNLARSDPSGGIMRGSLFESNQNDSISRDGLGVSSGDSGFSQNYRQVYASSSGESRGLHDGVVLRTSDGTNLGIDREFSKDDFFHSSYSDYYHDPKSEANVDEKSHNVLDKRCSPFQGHSAPDSSIYSSNSFDYDVTNPSRVHCGPKHRKRKLYEEERPVKKHRSDHYSSNSRSKHPKLPSKVSVQNRLGPQPMEDLRMQLNKQIPAIEKSKSTELYSMSSVSFGSSSLQEPPEKQFPSPSKSFDFHLGMQQNSLVSPLPSIKNESDLNGFVALSHVLPVSSDSNTFEKSALHTSVDSSNSLITERKHLHGTFKGQKSSHKYGTELCIKKNIESVDSKVREAVYPNKLALQEDTCVEVSSNGSKIKKQKSPTELPSILEQSHLKSSCDSMPTFPLLGKSNIKLPFSSPEENFKELSLENEEHSLVSTKASNVAVSDSESENALVIDVSKVPESPNLQLNSKSHSSVSSSAKNEDCLGSGFHFLTETTTEGIEVAEAILKSSLLDLLKDCSPNPLNVLYSSMKAVLKSINCFELSVPTVQHAFRSFAISKADQPWAIKILFRAEVASLLKSCEDNVDKWKSSANVFHNILKSLINKPNSKSCHQPQGSTSVSVPDLISPMSCRQSVPSIGKGRGVLKVTTDHTTAGQTLPEAELENDIGTDSSECNMSVCSVNNEEIIAIGERNQECSRSDSLSSGELTPTPPSSPVRIGFRSSINQLSQHLPYEKVSHTLSKSFGRASTSESKTVLEKKCLDLDKISSVADPLKLKASESHEKERVLKHNFSRDKSLDSKKESRSRDQNRGHRNNDSKGASSASHRRFLKKHLADLEKSRQVHRRLPSKSRQDYSGRSKSSLKRQCRKSLSPLVHKRPSISKQVSQHRHTRSPQAVHTKRNDLKRRQNSRSPEQISKNKKKVQSKGVDSDDDIELLQLKKEVILSIVKKPISSGVEIDNPETKPVSSKSDMEVDMKKIGIKFPDVNEAHVESMNSDVDSGTANSPIADTKVAFTKSRSIAFDSAAVSVQSSKPSTTTSEIVVKNTSLSSQSDNAQILCKDSQEKFMMKMTTKKSKDTRLSGPSNLVAPVNQVSSKNSVSKLQKLKSNMESSAPSSPTPAGNSNMSTGLPGSDSDNYSKEVSVMVFPGKENTWKIQQFQITSSGQDSDSEVGDQEVPADKPILSEVSSFLEEARKIASQASHVESSLESLTPPASLPPARKKEYIDLKKRIAWHEKQLIRKQCKGNSPRSSSPQLLRDKTEKQQSFKPLNQTTSTGLQAKSMDDNMDSLGKEVQECQRKMDQHKLLEEQEQQRISLLTNEMTICVSEIERHENELENMQNKLLNLKKLIEITGGALKQCERNMVNLTDEVRLVKTKKMDYNKVVVGCKAKISELETRIRLICRINKEDTMNTSNPEQIIGITTPLDKFEPISDPEELEMSKGSIGAGKLSTTEKQDSEGKAFSHSSLNCSETAEDTLRENMDDCTDILKEVTVGSTILDSSHTIFDSPSKLHNMLNKAMNNIIEMQLPCKCDNKAPTSYRKATVQDSTLLSSEGNLQPVVTSVLMSLTQQSFDKAIASTHGQILKKYPNEQEDYESGDMSTNFHDCTDNPFTLSTDDPPAFVLPIIVEGKLNLSVTEPAVSSVAMEAVNDGIIIPDIRIAENSSKNTRTSCGDEVGFAGSDVVVKSFYDTVVTNPGEISSDAEQSKMLLSLESVGDRMSIASEQPVTMKESSNTMNESESESKILDETSQEINTEKSLTRNNQGNNLVSSCGSSKRPVKKKSCSSMLDKMLVSKGKVDKDQIQSKPIRSISHMELDDQVSTNSGECKELSKMKDTSVSGNFDSDLMEVESDIASKASTSIAEDAEVSLPFNSSCEGRSISFEMAESGTCDRATMKNALRKHIQEIQRVKMQFVIPNDTKACHSHCARTSGFKFSSNRTTQPAQGYSEANSTESLIRRVASDHAQSCTSEWDDLHLAINTGMPLQFSIHEFIFSGGIIKALPSRNPSDVLPVKVTSSLPSSSNSNASCAVRSDNGFKPYVSPLLIFSSYRGNSNFSASANGPLTSLTYSSKLDPNKVLCQYELTGTCSDSSCTSQHLRDISMSKEEITQEVTFNSPSLVGCSAKELAGYSVASDVEKDRLAGKFTSYAENFVKQYSGKVSEEDFWKILLHEVKQEQLKSKDKKELIPFDCNFFSNADSNQAMSDFTVGNGATSYNFSVLPKLDSRRRYFNSESYVPKVTTASTAITNEHLSAAQDFLSEDKTQDAIEALEKGLDSKDSEDVWLKYMSLKSEIASETELQSLYDLLAKAVSSTKSYTIMIKAIQLCRCFDSKLRLINCSLTQCRSFESPEDASRYCFELFINVVLIHLFIGKLSVALKLFEQARHSLQPGQASSGIIGLIDVLQKRESILLCLCHLSVIYSSSLPFSLFTGDSHHTIPIRLSSLEFFAIPFHSKVDLTPSAYKKLLKLSKFYLDYLHDNSLPSSQAVERILPIFKNVIVFETVHGSLHKAVNILMKLSLLCPHFSDLWMMLARIKEMESGDGCKVLEKAICSSPRKPELYYLASRFELSRAGDTADSRSKAVDWLHRCVIVFYVTSDTTNYSSSEVLTLYRKLLNQMIGFKQTVPPFAEGVDPHNLKDELCPLWLCYCLLVELTVVPSTSTSGEELFHQSTEEAYESGIHAVRSSEGQKTLWKEYIFYLRSKADSKDKEDFLRLVDGVHRCLLDVDCYDRAIPLDSQCVDYSFHNEMLEVVTNCLPSSSSFKFELLQKLARRFPGNKQMVIQFVQCALKQKPSCAGLAQTVLAEMLALHPDSPDLWKEAIGVEQLLSHHKEARWMFNKALEVLPLHYLLWKNYMMFELRQLISARSKASVVRDTCFHAVVSVVKRAKRSGVDLRPVLQELMSTASSKT